MYRNNAELKDLVGKVVTKIENKDNKELIFTLDGGEQYKLYHEQDCCEDVSIEDIIGELDDLLNSPILMADASTNSESDPEDKDKYPSWRDSFTWTFYKLATIKGYVTIRWYGESNGYYSESVDFCKLD